MTERMGCYPWEWLGEAAEWSSGPADPIMSDYRHNAEPSKNSTVPVHELLRSLDEARKAGRPVAYTALVETRGSTPQKAGAAMLVFEDGSQVGTLGGGCVEAEVKQRALRILADGATEILRFDLDGDYGWDDGLICGGRMQMLVDPVRPDEGATGAYLDRLCERRAGDEPCTEVVVVNPEEAGGGTAGDRFLYDAEGTLLASRAVDDPPLSIAEHLRPLADRPRPYVAAGLSFLPHLKRCRLLIVGAGHVGQRVGALAAECDFEVTVLDDRDTYCNVERFPAAREHVVAPIERLADLPVDGDTFCIVVTRGHAHDEQALFQLVNRPARYLGMIGSRRKIRMIFDDLRAEGVSDEALARVHAPLGLDIGSQTVPEIAVSIVAELISVRNGAPPSP